MVEKYLQEKSVYNKERENNLKANPRAKFTDKYNDGQKKLL